MGKIGESARGVYTCGKLNRCNKGMMDPEECLACALNIILNISPPCLMSLLGSKYGVKDLSFRGSNNITPNKGIVCLK